jgi:hypothetical protein
MSHDATPYQMPARSHMMVGLLAAATICVDLLTIYWVFESQFTGEEQLSLFLALAFAQLSAVCVWAMSDRGNAAKRWIWPPVAGFAVALLITVADSGDRNRLDWEEFLAFIGFVAVHLVIVLTMLWFITPRQWLSKLLPNREHKRQFTTLHLLVLMTGTAILLTILRDNGRLDNDQASIATFGVTNAILLFAVLAILQTSWPMALRATSCLAIAIAMGAICEWMHLAFAGDLHLWAYFLIQAIVLVLWLEIAILPTNGDKRATAATASLST